MKIDNLMLGDWVLDKRTKRPLRVNPFMAEMEVPEWEPMFLTTEIIEKNGFEWIKNKIVDEAYVLTKTFWDEEPELIIRRFDFNESFVICTSRDNMALISIAYVHEFQHLLKLCDIDKEVII